MALYDWSIYLRTKEKTANRFFNCQLCVHTKNAHGDNRDKDEHAVQAKQCIGHNFFSHTFLVKGSIQK